MNNEGGPGIVVLVCVALAVATLDLLSKALALHLPVEGVEFLPLLDLRLAFNRGVSFGLFAAEGEVGRIALIALPVVAILVLFFLVWRAERAIERLGYTLIAGGAIGNLIDRLPDGTVTDFLDAHVNAWHFPTFNLADVSITLGVSLMVLSVWRPVRLLGSSP